VPVEMTQFLLKLLLKQKIVAVHHDFYWLLVATKLLAAKLHSRYVKKSEILERPDIPDSAVRNPGANAPSGLLPRCSPEKATRIWKTAILMAFPEFWTTVSNLSKISHSDFSKFPTPTFPKFPTPTP